jgi:hypothetical protein
MPKFYVQSGQVQVILDAQNAEQAAITAFQWWCERQAEAMFNVFDDDAEDRQLGNEMLVSEAGFGAGDAESFQTLDILMAWQVEPVEVARRAVTARANRTQETDLVCPWPGHITARWTSRDKHSKNRRRTYAHRYESSRSSPPRP